jgi:O-antigen/teichoic acid export membrane protein
MIKLLQNKDKFFAIADSAVISLGRFAAGIALARLAGAEAFAQYLLYATGGMIFMSLPTTLYITPMVNLAAGLDTPRRQGIFAWSQKGLNKAFLFGLGLSVICIPFVLYYKIDTLTYCGFTAATLALLQLQYARSCLQSLFKMKTAFIVDSMSTLLVIIIVAITYFSGGATITGFWWGTAVASSLAAPMMLRATRKGRAGEVVPQSDEKILMEAKRSGKAMLVGSLANTGCSRIQPFVLGGIGGTLAVANFGVSWSLIGPIRMLATALNGMLRPRLAMHKSLGDTNAFNRSLYLTYTVFSIVGLTGVLVGLFIGPDLIAFLFGEDFRKAGWLLPLAIAYGALDSLTTSQMVALQTKSADGAIIASKFRVIAAVISISLLVPGCIYAGAWGAYGALLVAEMFYAMMATLSLMKGFPSIDSREEPIEIKPTTSTSTV